MAKCSAASRSAGFALSRLLLIAVLAFVGCASQPLTWPPDNPRTPSYFAVSEPDIAFPTADSSFLVGSVVERATRDVLPGAVVRTSDAAFIATTDSLGRFRLAVAPGTYVVEVRFTGMNGVTTDSIEFMGGTVRDGRFELGYVTLY